jgi:serine protease Do
MKGAKLNLPEINWGNSESLEVGEPVLAIGNPYGFSQTASAGVVSALERVAPIGLVDPPFGVGEADTLLQTDASIHPGSSGGPLLNRKGEMIGLTTLFFSRTGEPSGISFAIPASRLRDLAEQLWASGSVRRTWVGLSAQDVDLDLSVYLGGYGSGVLVTEVIPGSPADGVLRAGDLVLEVDQSPVRGLLNFRQRVQASIPGMDLPLKFIRNQKEMQLSIRPILPVGENLVVTTRARQKAGQARAGQVARYQPQLVGMTLAEVPQSWLLVGRGERRETIKTPGAWIVDLATSSPALEAGVLPGDWLLEVNGVPLEGPHHFGKIPSDMTGDLLLSIRRGGPGGQKIYRLVRS